MFLELHRGQDGRSGGAFVEQPPHHPPVPVVRGDRVTQRRWLTGSPVRRSSSARNSPIMAATRAGPQESFIELFSIPKNTGVSGQDRAHHVRGPDELDAVVGHQYRVVEAEAPGRRLVGQVAGVAAVELREQ